MDARQHGNAKRIRVLLVPLAPKAWDQHLRALRCSENACAEGTLECGSGSYRLCARDCKAAASLPHSTALRAFSCKVVSRRIMESLSRAGAKGRRHIQNRILPQKILKIDGTNLRSYWKQRTYQYTDARNEPKTNSILRTKNTIRSEKDGISRGRLDRRGRQQMRKWVQLDASR
jgi:hypothetical protein